MYILFIQVVLYLKYDIIVLNREEEEEEKKKIETRI